MESKECKKCFEVKNLTEFWNQRSSKDGKQTYCKKCHNDKSFGNKRKIVSVIDIDGEIWEDISGYENRYAVSNFGRVKLKAYEYIRSQGRLSSREEHLMTIYITMSGYMGVRLSDNSKKYNVLVHRLVANAFIQIDQNRPHVNHINAIKTDNRVENLEWVTMSENMQHIMSMGISLGPKPENATGVKLDWEKVNEIRRLKKVVSQKDIAEKYGVSIGTISYVWNNRKWKE